MYAFGPFRLDVRGQRLLRDGEPVRITPRLYDTLLCLVESGGRLVSKEELLRTVWQDINVLESNLTQSIFLLRRLLGPGESRRYIRTVPGRGYLFVAEIQRETNGPLPAHPSAPEP